MRLGMMIDYSGGFEEAVEELTDYEEAGLDLIAIPEAYSFDAVSQLGYIAARTRTMELASAILQLYTRTPSLTAMTAAGLDHVSGGRFTLGLGASGPQVIEGFHGIKYDAPLGRTREVIEICRKVWQREPVIHEGKHYQIPLPADQGTGLGKPLKIINHPLRPRIPISVAAIGPKNVELVAEVAEAWQPLFFHPGKKDLVWGESLEAGLAKRDPQLGELDIMLSINFAFGDPEPLHLQRVRDQLALYIGGMGARGKNFYNSLATRYGYEAEAKEIQDLYLAGKKAEAAAAVPDDLLHAVALLGDEDHLRARVAEFKAAGVTTFLLTPLGETPERRLADVAKLAEIVKG
ncbi:LLM class F420-dependent oxidoreductase [Nocardioides sp. AE5]|uniref:LLM class F420-dependent oxidoreductase n=1 Tax=Nocardioides sp. AE5 TaxID=2962573 RepID=UPI0028828FFA|nr:LLM class F420-dependent oxidoreductase [Nocardioides sp. AE5]MDT0203237.1 LLM class F420-dependent oxidoreductase [Nocardioides sp. AE5]